MSLSIDDKIVSEISPKMERVENIDVVDLFVEEHSHRNVNFQG